MVMLWRRIACIRNDTPCIDCQTKRYLKESTAAYVNAGVLHIHQTPGDGQEVQPLRRRCSQHCRSKSWSQHKAVRTAEVCAAHDDLEIATRTPTVSISSTAFTSFVSCRLSCKSNVLPVVPATMRYEYKLGSCCVVHR
jgi:hypothetical protein